MEFLTYREKVVIVQFGRGKCAVEPVIKWFGVQNCAGMRKNEHKNKKFDEMNNEWNK